MVHGEIKYGDAHLKASTRDDSPLAQQAALFFPNQRLFDCDLCFSVGLLFLLHGIEMTLSRTYDEKNYSKACKDHLKIRRRFIAVYGRDFKSIKDLGAK